MDEVFGEENFLGSVARSTRDKQQDKIVVV